MQLKKFINISGDERGKGDGRRGEKEVKVERNEKGERDGANQFYHLHINRLQINRSKESMINIHLLILFSFFLT